MPPPGSGRASDPAPNRNALWARTLAQEWGAAGLRHVCVGSGSRCAPLVEAFTRDARFQVHPHVDERSAAFFALGVAAATGVPAAVVTTSGTAAANLYPAVIEASQGELPLLVVTADRPPGLRGLDANQTIEQAGMFGGYVRLAIDLPLPRPAKEDLRRLRVAAARGWAAALGLPPGPVHLNVPFEKPLEPTPVPGDVPAGLEGGSGTPAARPHTRVRPARGADEGAALASACEGARHPLIVCGPTHDAEVGRAALELAATLGVPLLADPLSGARFAPGAPAHAVARGDVALRDERVAAALAPDLVLRVGASPTSASVTRYLERHGAARQVVVDAGGRWKDHAALARDYICGAPAETLRGAARHLGHARADPDWTARWRAVDEAAGTRLAEALARDWFEGTIAACVTEALPAGGTLFVGNSMPIRDVDAFAAARDVEVRAIGLRGASGIDGNVSAALGAACARRAPAAALIGDLTLLHDVGALLAERPAGLALQIVVVQNRGGGIFHMLPIRDYDPPFDRFVVMPQAVDLAAVAAAARIPHRLTPSRDALAAALAAGWERPGIHLLEAQVDRRHNWERRDSAVARAATAARDAL